MSASTGTYGIASVGLKRTELDVGPSVDERIGSFVERVVGRFFTIRPYEDGLTLIILLGMLATVAWSVQLAGWLNGPLTQPTVFIGGVMGILAARHRFGLPIAHLAAFIFGWIVIFWQVGQSADGGNIIETSRDVWERFFIWLEAARNGGISRDPLPFEVMLLSVAWIVSYLSSWILFKFRNVWFPVIILGTAIVINLSYRQGQFEYTMFIFVALAIVLFAHITAIQRAIHWEAAGIRFPAHLRGLSIQFGATLGILVVLIAAVLPLWEPRNDQVQSVWGAFKSPFRTLEDDVARLLSGVKGNKSNGFGAFNDALPFKGSINLPDEPVMFVETVFPTLHAGRIYAEYTSQGWLTGPTIEQTTLGGDVLVRREDLKARRLITQRFTPNVDTNWVMPVGNTLSITEDGVSEVLAPVEWILTMVEGDLGPLPSDVRRFADALRDEFVFLDEDEIAPVGRKLIEERTRQLLPDGLAVISLGFDRTGSLHNLRVGRADPPPIEQIAFTPAETINRLDSYLVDQLISTATDEELGAAGTDYPAWVTDRYLQLPDELPITVRSLAERIVSQAGAETPFEKAASLQEFLQQQGYSQVIDGPRPDQDAIEYFLFDTVDEPCPNDRSPNPCENNQLKGYSQYFGSAMAVMLRSVGVPSRMVAGYTAGSFLPQQTRFIILGSDRHGWAQAYFPDYGWIDVEATPGYALFSRGSAFSASPQSGDLPPLTEGGLFEAGFFLDEDLSELEAAARLLALEQRRAELSSGTDIPVVAIAAPIMSILGLLTLGMTLWHFGLGKLTPAERAYVKMNRLGRMAGLRRAESQTATEYAGILAARLPTITTQAYAIADGYQACVYGHRMNENDAAEMNEAWKQMRSALLGRSLRRLIGR
ncbi:MAG: transglutaminase domain-containing protein [Chloroflexi bacterium]|nr:transglutaminase domain-containing protein [Chloroflexota bacterium]